LGGFEKQKKKRVKREGQGLDFQHELNSGERERKKSWGKIQKRGNRKGKSKGKTTSGGLVRGLKGFLKSEESKNKSCRQEVGTGRRDTGGVAGNNKRHKHGGGT